MKIVPDHAAGHDRETATSHYFDEEPSTPSRPHVVTLELPDMKLEIVTDAGVFGAQKQKVDPGTRTLLMLAPDPPPEGEILDLGRTRRLFSPAQRKALAIRDRHCRAQGCDIPAAWCEAHHAKNPWAKHGNTDLADGLLLCSFHHHRAHDPTWDTRHHPNGTTTFHRRT